MKLYKQEILKFDIPNKNGHIYSSDMLCNISKPIVGYIGMSGEQSLANASHLISNLWCEDNILYADIEVLNTPSGKNLSGMLTGLDHESNCNCGFRTSGEGTLSDDGTIKDFNLQSINFVLDPA